MYMYICVMNMEIICKTQWYVSVMDCSCINICLHSCAPWKSKRHWVSCSGAPEEYPRHPYIQDDVHTEKDVLGPSRNLFGGFVCRGFIISKKKQTLRNNNWSFTFRFNSRISVSDWNTCQQYNTGGWKLAISHIWAILQHQNMVDFPCLLYSMIGKPSDHPAFLKADPTTSSTKFVKVFFCLFLFVLSSADFGRQWGETIWNVRCWSYDFGRKKHYKRHLRIVYIYVLKKLSIEIKFSFSVSRFQKPTLKRYPPGAEPESVVKERGESQTSTKDPRQGIFR